MSGKIKREELVSELVDELDKDLKIKKISDVARQVVDLKKDLKRGEWRSMSVLFTLSTIPPFVDTFRVSLLETTWRERAEVFFSNIIATRSTWLKASSNTCTCRCCFFAILGPTRSEFLTKSFTNDNFHFFALSHHYSQSASWCLEILG